MCNLGYDILFYYWNIRDDNISKIMAVYVSQKHIINIITDLWDYFNSSDVLL